MAHAQPAVGGTVLSFRPRLTACASLTMRDRMEVTAWREDAQDLGYDRLMIHERVAGDPPEVDSFLSVYRRGEPWARWGVTRMGDGVVAWCCRTGEDAGRFGSVSDALHTLLSAKGARRAMPAPIPFPNQNGVDASRLQTG